MRQTNRGTLFVAWLAVCSVSVPSQVDAEPKGGTEEAPSDGQKQDLIPGLGNGTERPWATGVSSARQTAALDRFREGNALVRDSLFRQAVEKYRQALAQWDHPAIHYNMVLALINFDQPLEVREHLQAALKYGPDPLDEKKFDYGKSYLKLLEKQLAPIEVRCDVPGATVRLDGQVLFHAPGHYEALVRPGPHTVVATKDGYPPTERSKILLPGQSTSFDLKLYAQGELIGYRRRWPMWQPVVVTAAGAAVVGAAIVLTLQAKSQFDEFDKGISTRGECSSGCLPEPVLSQTKSRGTAFQTASAVLYAAGGATIAGGIVLLVLNGSTPYRIEPAERAGAFSVTPFLGATAGGLIGTTRF